MAPEVPLSRVFALSKDDWPWIVLGLVGSGCLGMYLCLDVRCASVLSVS
jgi:hypothetical protein